MKQRTKLTPKHEHVAEHQTQQAHEQATQEFSNSDEALRYEAAQITVPPEIAERLKKSAAHLPPPPPRTWWRQLFNR